MTKVQLINVLLGDGAITREAVNRYKVHDTYFSRTILSSGIPTHTVYTRDQILEMFAVEVPAGSGDYRLRLAPQGSSTASSSSASGSQRAPLRRITRSNYHSTGSGTSRDGVRGALENIPVDEDGVRRSFGLEYEIYSLNSDQEDKLARLLDTLPPHVTERDGSLGSNGVEIVFLPMSADKYIDTWNKLKEFVRENHVPMDDGGTVHMAGAHTTYGVSNSHVSVSDLQIRLNRLALAVKSVGTQRQIKRMFGRDFGNFRVLPNTTTHNSHDNAFSASRGTSAWECRLCSWSGDAERIVSFLKRSEFVFNRAFTASDFVDIFEILGGDTSES